MKIKQLVLALFIALFCSGAITNHYPWDGTVWVVTSPNDEALLGNAYKEIYDLRKGVALRMNYEHETLATDSAGGTHAQGSAVAFFQDAEEAKDGDDTFFATATDAGHFWIDTNATPDNRLYFLLTADGAGAEVWEPIATSLSGETWTWTGAHTWDDGTTDSPALTLTDATNEDCAIVKLDNGNTTVTIPADTDLEIVTGNLAVGDDSPGTAAMDGEDAYIEGELEVDGVATLDSNVTVGGTLTVTGESTFNNHINLGDGDDLLGSATSDITINTDKFTVAGATGNTVVAGTLGVTGVITSAATPGLAKGFAVWDGSGGATIAADASLNVTGNIAFVSTGKWTITWGTDFSSADYAVSAICSNSVDADAWFVSVEAIAAGTISIITRDHDGSTGDPDYISVIAFGAQ